MLGLGEGFGEASSEEVLLALRKRRELFALRSEVLRLRSLDLRGRLGSQSGPAGEMDTTRRLLHWLLDLTELPFYLVVSWLSC